jgi:hypothetical protein
MDFFDQVVHPRGAGRGVVKHKMEMGNALQAFQPAHRAG